MNLTFGDKESGIIAIKALKLAEYDIREGHECDCEYCTSDEQGGYFCTNCDYRLASDNYDEDEFLDELKERGNKCPKCGYKIDNEDDTKCRLMRLYNVSESDLSRHKS